jgi:hypothetical protein
MSILRGLTEGRREPRQTSGLRRAPKESKQIQTNPRKKAWISLDSFGRFGTFQWLTANPSKKFFSQFPTLSEPFSTRRSGKMRRLGKSTIDFGY